MMTFSHSASDRIESAANLMANGQAVDLSVFSRAEQVEIRELVGFLGTMGELQSTEKPNPALLHQVLEQIQIDVAPVSLTEKWRQKIRGFLASFDLRQAAFPVMAVLGIGVIVWQQATFTQIASNPEEKRFIANEISEELRDEFSDVYREFEELERLNDDILNTLG